MEESSRWVLGPEENGSERLMRTFAKLGFKVDSRWRYPVPPALFAVPFSDGRVEILVEFETPEGVVASGPSAALDRLRAEYDCLPPVDH